jgi:hypothetical protein
MSSVEEYPREASRPIWSVILRTKSHGRESIHAGPMTYEKAVTEMRRLHTIGDIKVDNIISVRNTERFLGNPEKIKTRLQGDDQTSDS